MRFVKSGFSAGFLMTLLFGFVAFGQEQVVETVLPPPPRAEKNYLVSLNYSLVDFPIPSKMGLTVGMIKTPTQTWEVEFMRGSLSVPGGFRDLASVTDTRVGVIGRTYFSETFHMSYGVTYFDFSATLGDALMNNLSNGTYPNVDMLALQGFGANVGIGNTWTINNKYTIGVDWLTLAQPLVITKKSFDYVNYATNENDKKNVEDTMTVISYLPRLAAVSVHFGMLF